MCYSLWYNAPTMLPAGNGRQHRWCIIPQAVTHSLVLLKMGKIIAPKHVELTGIINMQLLLLLVGCLYYLCFIIFFGLSKQSQFIPLQNVVYFITLPFFVSKNIHILHK